MNYSNFEMNYSHFQLEKVYMNAEYIKLGCIVTDLITIMIIIIKKEYLRIRKVLETKLSSRYLIKGMNTWALHPV